ncbi:lactonase family protein [Flaviramulus aquimarinus]|uniref:Lactonase family protein n=1 Tax=Flaviramulus aquimarinus TaxID=1170456 RepID=A0ABP9EZA6_9FLAO
MKLKLYTLLLTLSILNCTAQDTTLYVGTYTGGDSEGIYKLTFNTETGALTNKELVAKAENPSYLSYSPDKKHIYAVVEHEKGMVSSFKITDNKHLTLLSKVSTHGAHPCHVAINKSGNKAIVSNYTGGNASIHTIANDGTLTEAFQVLEHNVDSIVSHVHSAEFYKNQLYVSDLGKNAVYNYQLENDKFKLIDSSIVDLANHAGPRHFALTNNGKFIYIINEYSSSITVGQKTEKGFTKIDEDSTLEADYNGKNSCADIHLSKDERFLYASNRGENTIAVFKRETNSGTINKIQTISVHGNWPRNFTLDPTGQFLLVANRWSHNISVFSVNASTGLLKFMHDTKISEPVCLLF